MKGKETKHLAAFTASKLKSSEELLGHLDGWIGEMMGKGAKAQHNGQFIVTSERVCFYRKGLLGEVFETIPLSKITSIETLSRMGYRVLRLHTSHDELAFKTFEAKEDFEPVYELLETARRGPPAVPASNESASIPDKIRALADLRDSGILTDSEFAAKKAELLHRM